MLRSVLIAGTFFGPDASLRCVTRWLGYYSIFELAPSLFSLCWICIFVVILSLFPRRTGRIIYLLWYGVWAVYAAAQYIYYLIFNKFFFLTDMANAAEGAAYLDFVWDVLNHNVWLQIILFLVMGTVGFMQFPDFRKLGNVKSRRILRGVLTAVGCIGIAAVPSLYTDHAEGNFFSSTYEYEQFTNSGFDMEITGLYQYVARDAWITYLMPRESAQILYKQVEECLDTKSEHADNAMTGIFKGKNLILVQLESLDDWIVTPENTPTIFRMMQEGINFTNMHTCIYGSGSTFSTEFAFNTGIYQSTKGVGAYSATRNSYPYSLANILGDLGYATQSFHQNVGSYYNRAAMHEAIGYDTYYCTRDYLSDDLNPEVDVSVIADDTCWELLTQKRPFFSFLITYSAHIAYNAEDDLASYALSLYPQYNNPDRDDELNYLYAKSRLTDDMFDAMLKRLEEDGLLQDTVIIAYDDHYNYGLSDKELVQQLSEANGSPILERTPAFIWYAGCEHMEVDKVCQTIDWVPTIANLFGVDVATRVLGNDIFDDAYEGYAVFPDGTWLTSDAYIVNGIVRWNDGMTDEEIAQMNSYVQGFYAANEAILSSDYYEQFEE